MKVDQTLQDHLDGKLHDTAFKIKVASGSGKMLYRLNLLEKISKNKNVIHVGFADHLPAIDRKIKEGTWAHGRIKNAAKRALGVDINEEAINHVKSKNSIDDIFHYDIINDAPLKEILEQKWDVMILGEILEHVDNPVLFLKTIREKYHNNIKQLVITGPNAFDWANIKLLHKNTEFINTDHRYWFSPYTLAKMGVRAGYKFEKVEMCQAYDYSNGMIGNFLLKRFPILRDTIMIVLNF